MPKFMFSQAPRLACSLALGFLVLAGAMVSRSALAADAATPVRWSLLDGLVAKWQAVTTLYDLRSALPEVRPGLGLAGGSWFVQGTSGWGLAQRGNQYRREVQGVGDGWRLALVPTTAAGWASPAMRPSVVALGVADSLSYTLSGGWQTPLGDGSTVLSILGTGGAGPLAYGRDDAERQFWGPRVQLQKSFSDRLDGFAAAGATFYSDRGTLPQYLGTRRDTLYDLTVGLNWTVGKGLSVRPQLSFIKNGTGSAESYVFDRADTSVNLRFDY